MSVPLRACARRLRGLGHFRWGRSDGGTHRRSRAARRNGQHAQRMLVHANADHVGAAIGDVKAFFVLQAQRCADLGIDVADFPIGHVAHRSRTWREYVATRDELERVASANVENVWNGRPISKLLLEQPVSVSERHEVELHRYAGRCLYRNASPFFARSKRCHAQVLRDGSGALRPRSEGAVRAKAGREVRPPHE
jgi:hypothetical protein